MSTVKQYEFIIHTNRYSGNFEKSLRGFMTGYEGDYDHNNFYRDLRIEVGLRPDCDWAEETEKNPFVDLFRNEFHTEYGYRMEGTAKTPEKYKDAIGDRSTTSVVLFCTKKPSISQINVLKQRARKFAEMSRMENRDDRFGYLEPLDILGFSLIDVKITRTRKDLPDE
jgi:hypothetical protein